MFLWKCLYSWFLWSMVVKFYKVTWNTELVSAKTHVRHCFIGNDWCWEGLGAGGEGDDRGWDGWMASPTWVWVNSGSWWWTGRPGMLRFMRSQRVRHDWAAELNGTEWFRKFTSTKSSLILFRSSSLFHYVKVSQFIWSSSVVDFGSVFSLVSSSPWISVNTVLIRNIFCSNSSGPYKQNFLIQ